MRRCGTGLTLVELLVTIALLSVVIATVMGTLVGGVVIWQRTQDHAAFDQTLLLTLETVRRDLHNLQRFQPISFEGSYDTLSFPAVLEEAMVDGVPLPEVSCRGYYFNLAQRALYRGAVPYRRSRAVSWRDASRPLAGTLERVRFAYYVPDPTTGGYRWAEAWVSPEPPLAVKVELGARRSSKDPLALRTLIVHLPSATVR